MREISEMANFIYLRQKLPKGDGDALICAKPLIQNEPNSFKDKLVYKAKVSFTSSGTNSPKLVGIGLRALIKSLE